MRTLILGGTAWLGREIAEQLVARGEDVTCLARGESGAVPPGVTSVRTDRRDPGAYDSVKGSDWDEIIELTYEAELVTGALEALADNAQHWTLVSSVSVYASNSEPGADEEAALVEPTDLDNYAHAKVAAERATTEAVGASTYRETGSYRWAGRYQRPFQLLGIAPGTRSARIRSRARCA